MTQDIVLIEIFTEELPPKALKKLGGSFAYSIFEQLAKQQFVSSDVVFSDFATPRRLSVIIPSVLAEQPEQLIERKGPAVTSGYKDNQPTPALLGFARSCGVDIDVLEKMSDGKQEVYVFRTTKAGSSLDAVLPDIVSAALKQLPAPKLMRWGNGEAQFIRPIHGLIMMRGSRLISGEVMGLKSRNITYGHRFLSGSPITISSADQYEQILEIEGCVIASFAKRREKIASQLKPFLEQEVDSVLLDEVTALVESPAVYEGNFSKDFLSVPQECLVLSMKQHQKYFPITNSLGMLQSRFAVVSNLPTETPQEIIHGNERVLHARLSDAQFFYKQDKKIKLVDRVEKLANVVYHNKLGSQLQRTQRLQKLAGEIARKLNADVGQAERAAYLCKADLLTDMVGEFPELQGIMGRYYASHDGETTQVAGAIQYHYLPRGAGDCLPEDKVSICVALADKLDTLVGIYGVGLIPSGDKDPFGLRRAALGVLRILIEKELTLDSMELLQLAKNQYPPNVVADSVAFDLHGFMLERLKNYLREKDFAPDEIEAVISKNPSSIADAMLRLNALKEFRTQPGYTNLVSASKRIRNILKGLGSEVGTQSLSLPPGYQQNGIEVGLHEQLDNSDRRMSSPSRRQSPTYTDYLNVLSGLYLIIDKFFAEIMILDSDPAIRNYRVRIVRDLDRRFNIVADLSKLQS